MESRDPHSQHLHRLRTWRIRPDRDLSMAFLKQDFKRQIEKPYKQLAQLVTLWDELVPRELAQHTRLESVSRGVLTISCSSSVHLYELDRLLRNGLERDLIRHHNGPAFRKVRLQVGEWESAGGSPPPARKPAEDPSPDGEIPPKRGR